MTKIAELNGLKDIKDIWKDISLDSSITILQKAEDLFDPKNANSRNTTDIYNEIHHTDEAKAWRLWKVLAYAIQKILTDSTSAERDEHYFTKTIDGVIGNHTKKSHYIISKRQQIKRRLTMWTSYYTKTTRSSTGRREKRINSNKFYNIITKR